MPSDVTLIHHHGPITLQLAARFGTFVLLALRVERFFFRLALIMMVLECGPAAVKLDLT